jgi:hypothetical protein
MLGRAEVEAVKDAALFEGAWQKEVPSVRARR